MLLLLYSTIQGFSPLIRTKKKTHSSPNFLCSFRALFVQQMFYDFACCKQQTQLEIMLAHSNSVFNRLSEGPEVWRQEQQFRLLKDVTVVEQSLHLQLSFSWLPLNPAGVLAAAEHLTISPGSLFTRGIPAPRCCPGDQTRLPSGRMF